MRAIRDSDGGSCEGGSGGATATRSRDTTFSIPFKIFLPCWTSQILLYKDRPIFVAACGGGEHRMHQSPAVLGALGKRIVPRLQASKGRLGLEVTFVTALCAPQLGLGFRYDSFHSREGALF